MKIDDEKISVKELEEIFEKIGTKRQKFLMDLQRKNLDKDIESYYLEGKEKEEYDKIEDEEESKLQINSNDIFEKLKMRLKEKKKKMNLGLVHPLIYYLNNFILIMFFLGWLGSYIKRESWILNLSLIIIYYLGVSGASILSSIIIIFLFSADFLLNLDLFKFIDDWNLYLFIFNIYYNV